MKGALEDAVKKLGFERLAIFKPPILVRKETDRTGEKIGLQLIGLINKIGGLKSQAPLRTELLAEAMYQVANKQYTGTLELQNAAIRAAANA